MGQLAKGGEIMANHVSFNISATEEVDFVDAFKMHTYTRKYQDHSWEVTESLELEKQDFMQEAEPKFDDEGHLSDSWEWYVNNVGAKWCCIEDVEENYVYGYSAWSPPIEMLGYLAKHMKAHLQMTYEDEFRNFIGVAWADDDGSTSFEEIDGEELLDKFLEQTGMEELPEDFDWSDEIVVDEVKHCADEYYDSIVYNWFDEQ